MLRELKNNNRGVVFITVLIIIIISMVLAVNILSLNISQVKTAENELKYIQAELLAEGALARILVRQFSGSPANVIAYEELLGSSSFSIVANIDGSGPNPIGSDSVPLTIDVTF